MAELATGALRKKGSIGTGAPAVPASAGPAQMRTADGTGSRREGNTNSTDVPIAKAGLFHCPAQSRMTARDRAAPRGANVNHLYGVVLPPRTLLPQEKNVTVSACEIRPREYRTKFPYKDATSDSCSWPKPAPRRERRLYGFVWGNHVLEAGVS
jgi:hypothetical protein